MANVHYKIESGDTLSKIAKGVKAIEDGKIYKSSVSKLVAWNNIKNPNLIHAGDKIIIGTTSGKVTSSKSSSSSKTSKSSNKCKIDKFGLQNGTDSTLFATWTWTKSNTKEYKYEWKYTTGDGVKFEGSSSTSTKKQSTYTIPSNAKSVFFRVKPIAKEISYTETNKKGKKVTKKKTAWTADWTNYKEYKTSSLPPSEPPTPSDVKIENMYLKCLMDDLDIKNAKGLQFQIVKVTQTKLEHFKYIESKFTKNSKKLDYVSISCPVNNGYTYKVRCRSYRGNEYSEWSGYSSEVGTAPSSPEGGITSIKRMTATEVQLDWKGVRNATGYTIEYTTKKRYFGSGSQEVSSVTVGKDDKNPDGSTATHKEITGLESGKEWFFRIKATNDNGSSAWSSIKSIILGDKPGVPTTWSSTTTGMIGETLYLYWVHNSSDGSSESIADIIIDIDNHKFEFKPKNTATGDKKDETKIFTIGPNVSASVVEAGMGINTKDSKYSTLINDGAVIKWQVRTAGIDQANFSNWSIPRQIDLYAPPTLTIGVFSDVGCTNQINTVERFPFYIKALAGPPNYTPIGYHVSIISNTTYEETDSTGEPKIVSNGEVIYSQYYDAPVGNTLQIEMSPSFINLEPDADYTIEITVSMNNGLTATDKEKFFVSWEDLYYEPNGEVIIDNDIAATYIRPYCSYEPIVYKKAELQNGVWNKTDEIVDVSNIVDHEILDDNFIFDMSNKRDVYKIENYLNPYDPQHLETFDLYYCKYINENGKMEHRICIELVSGIFFMTEEETKEQTGTKVNNAYAVDDYTIVYEGLDSNNNQIHYYQDTGEAVLVPNVTLSVYRREFDGNFVEIASGLDNSLNTFVTDPHPSLDYARYRIVAVDSDTGSVSYTDLPGIPMDEKGIIIQWNEEWSNFNITGDYKDPLDQPPWTGSLLRLPYNVDISDNKSQDVELIEYAGRKHPVSYYGTQLGETANWNLEIPADDIETLYQLRRLAVWMGDCYVRESSGTGYWANITVSISKTHLGVTIPVSISLTRVEGGI